jgi:hypothetical protein
LKSDIFIKYKRTILFNKNLLLSGSVSFLIGVITTQIYTRLDSNNISNVVITLIVGYCIYIPFFAFLFYRDNKARYIDQVTKKKKIKNIREDVIKLFGTFSISEVVFIVTKLYIHYSLLELNFQPYQALTIAELTAWVIFLVLINTGIKIVKLFK